MITQTKTSSLEKFLTVTAGSKEIGLIIAKDSNELNDFVRFLDEMDFKRTEKATDFSRLQKTYFVIDENKAKDAYDFVVQYPTRSVRVFDKIKMKIETFFPDYQNLNIVFLVLKDDIFEWQKQGLDFISAVGPVYQS